MEDLKIEDIDDTDDYVPEDPNAPVDDFEISDIEIESYMPEDLKIAIRRYNEIHARTLNDLLESDEEDEENDNNLDEDEIDIVENGKEMDLKNIF